MNERDRARTALKKTTGDKWIALQKYRSLRNRVTSQIRKDVITENGKKIDSANDESEYWHVVNGIINPKTEPSWKLNEDGNDVTDEKDIAESFNNFFVSKTDGIKAKIDNTIKDDPLIRLKKKVENKNLKFLLKTVSVKTVTKIMKKMKKKKSAGTDGVTQECLLMGVDVVAEPLTHIINTSQTYIQLI